MKKAKILIDNQLVGYLIERKKNSDYEFCYLEDYSGNPISLTLPITQKKYLFKKFPPFFDGLLPEGYMLNALLSKAKIDKNDRFEQLIVLGRELVGNVTVERDAA